MRIQDWLEQKRPFAQYRLPRDAGRRGASSCRSRVFLGAFGKLCDSKLSERSSMLFRTDLEATMLRERRPMKRLLIILFTIGVAVLATGPSSVRVLAQNRTTYSIVGRDSGHVALGLAIRKLGVYGAFIQAPGPSRRRD